MKRNVLMLLVTCAMAASPFAQTNPKSADPRLRDVVYDPAAVVTVPVKRGMVTLVVLAQDEVITEVAAGQGGDCSKADAVWCVAAQPGAATCSSKPSLARMHPTTWLWSRTGARMRCASWCSPTAIGNSPSTA